MTIPLFDCFVKEEDVGKPLLVLRFECPLCGWRYENKFWGLLYADVEEHLRKAHGLRRWLDMFEALAEACFKVDIDHDRLAMLASALRVPNRYDVAGNFLAAYLKIVHRVKADWIAFSEKGMKNWERKIRAVMHSLAR